MRGGPPRAFGLRRDEFARNQAELVSVALKPWGSWYGKEAACQTRKAVEENIGGIVAASTRRNYEGHFEKWEVFRGVDGLSPYIDSREARLAGEEDSVIAYVAFSVGPLGKEVSTMVTHLSAIGYFHRIRTGGNPLTKMSRVQLMIKGLRRASGPERRKLPFSLEDMRALQGLLNLKEVGQFDDLGSHAVGVVLHAKNE